MEFISKSRFYIKMIIPILGITFTFCQPKNKKINCDKINIKSAYYLNQYYIEKNKFFIDSASYFTDLGIKKCEKYKSLLSLRKLSILSEKKDYSTAIRFINNFDRDMFSDLPYYKDLLILRFKAMEAIKEGSIDQCNSNIKQCVILVKNYLQEKKNEYFVLLKSPKIENILINPLSTALTQYYYYKSIINKEDVIKELSDLSKEKNVNHDFIDYLNDYLNTDFMIFEGI